MKVGYLNTVIQRIPIRSACKGCYLRWWYNGWHYWFFKAGEYFNTTEGEVYRSIGTKTVNMYSGYMTFLECQSLRGVLLTREIYLLTDYGWMNIRVDSGEIITSKNQINAYELEIKTTIGSKEISYTTGFSPVSVMPEYPKADDDPLYDPEGIVVVHHNPAGTFTLTVAGFCEIVIYWGDGEYTNVALTEGAAVTLTHTYTTPGEYVVTITNPECLQVLIIEDQHVTVVLLPPTIVNLEILDLSGNELTELIIPPEAISLVELDLSDNLFTEPPVIPDTVHLIIFNMDGNPLIDALCQITIGEQIWMCRNYDSDYPGSRVYDDDPVNAGLWGRLYSQNMVKSPGFTPSGWHVPSVIEWEMLQDYIGTILTAGGILKEAGTTHWNAPNTGATDAHSFTALPGGSYIGSYAGAGTIARLWTSNNITVGGVLNGYYFQMYYNYADLLKLYLTPDVFLSVRLISNYKPPLCEVVIGVQIWQCSNAYNRLSTTNKVYNNDTANYVIYGGLYTWWQAMAVAALYPSWHLPTKAEWEALIIEAGGTAVAGGHLKEAGLTHWNNPNTDADDSSGFTALGGGIYSQDTGTYNDLKNIGYFWTADAFSSIEAYCVLMQYNSGATMMTTTRKLNYCSVRLIRNFTLNPGVLYDDWFLPSKDEMQAIHDNLQIYGFGNFVYGVYYYCSSEYSFTNAWGCRINTDADWGSGGKDYSDMYVRAIRKFTAGIGVYSLRDTGPAGGLIFYIDGITYYECALEDVSSGNIWSNVLNVVGTSTNIGEGQNNTNLILAQAGFTTGAAKDCDDYEITA